MLKIIIYSDMFYTTHPYLDIPLYNYIKNKGINVAYALHEKDIRLTNKDLYTIYSKINLLTVKKPKHLGSLFTSGDVLVMRWAYKLDGDAAARSVSHKNKVLMYDVPGIDIRLREAAAHYLAVKGDSLVQSVNKKFGKRYSKVTATGLLHGDLVNTTSVNKAEFMKSYGMDPNKKLLLLTPANPGEAHMKGLKDDYTKIANIVHRKCNNYELAVKAHPNDYTAKIPAQPGIIHKNGHYGGRCSWEVFSPGIKVIKADEGYNAIMACDAILNVRSSLAMEISLFKKPIININRKKYITNWPFDPKCMMDINISELRDVLDNNKYSSNDSAWDDYVKKHMHANDGKAHERIGEMAIKILNGTLK